jgi:hypothetical protein
MDAALSGALRDGTYGWLERVDAVLRDADTRSRAALAEIEVPRMIAALRALLADHEPDEDGRCHRCSRWRRHDVRCSVWVTAHRHLVLNDPSGNDTGRHAMNTGRGSAL